MFYSQLYLRKNGRFGLIWLAATQSRVLSRRELAAVNISMTVADILEHVPGQLNKDVNNRPRRFSLYLSSQLMYGSVKVLQKQWDFLFGDITTLMKRFHPEVPTHEIDLIIMRQEPLTLESCVPTSIKDKCYDPFFGVFKENEADIEALLTIWDHDYVRQELHVQEKSPVPFKPEPGSPHSVSDARQIQIQDHHETSISTNIPSEQDLPCLDAEHLALIQSTNQQFDITVEELVTPAVSRIISNQLNESQLAPPKVSQPLEQMTILERPIEETPARKTTREQPDTPQKPKRKWKDDGQGGKKRMRNLDAEEKVPSDDAASRATQQPGVTNDDTLRVENQTSPIHAEPQVDLSNSPRTVGKSNLTLPEPAVPENQNWHQANTSFQLSPIPPSPSPLRRRRPHRLIIDENLQLMRSEMQRNIESGSETSVSSNLPSLHQSDFFKEPASSALRNPVLSKLWARNCKFGLKTCGPTIFFPRSPSLKRKESTAVYETPAKMMASESTSSRPPSMEKGRDTSAISAINESRERSKSLVGQASDDSTANISSDHHQNSTHLEQEKSLLEISLAPLPEEQEQILSPIPLEKLPEHNSTTEVQNASLEGPQKAQGNLLKVVCEMAGQRGNWTTFRAVCPPQSSSRAFATMLFQELCDEVANETLRVRQDKPYGEIYIWEPDEESSL